ncbi:hypothetical protein PINS_up011965 [Pythium insidiosum]|nr:hypothetical protein PINS_up011965 [Pythium insidiosum]
MVRIPTRRSFTSKTGGKGPSAVWTVETLGNGKVAFKSDNGRYLARCNNCAGGFPADRAFVHSTSAADPWAQWEVGCINGPRSGPPDTENLPVNSPEDSPKKHEHKKKAKKHRHEDSRPEDLQDNDDEPHPTRAGESGIEVYVLNGHGGQGAMRDNNALDHDRGRRHCGDAFLWVIILPFFCIGVFVTMKRVIAFLRESQTARQYAAAMPIASILNAAEEEHVPLRIAEST